MTETAQLYNLFRPYQIQEVLLQIQVDVEHEYFEIWKNKIKTVHENLKNAEIRGLFTHPISIDSLIMLYRTYNDVEYKNFCYGYCPDDDTVLVREICGQIDGFTLKRTINIVYQKNIFKNYYNKIFQHE